MKLHAALRRTLILSLAAATWAADPPKPPLAMQGALLALTHAALYDGTGAPVQRDMTVVVRDGRIVAVGSSGKVAIPKGASVADLSGHTLTPGLVMLHEHTFYPVASGAYGAMFETFPRLYLAGGATTIRTAGSMSPYADLNLKRDIDSGTSYGPDMDVTAPFLNGPVPFVMQVPRLENAEQAASLVEYWASMGTTSYKAYMHLTRAQLGAVVKAAHGHGQKVTGHLCAITYREAAELGIDNLEHGFAVASDFVPDKQPDVCPRGDAVLRSLNALKTDAPEMDALQAELIRRKVAVTSTLTVFETFATGRPLAPPAALDVLIPQLREQYVSRWSSINSLPPNGWAALLPKEMAWEKRFVQAGGLLTVGTDPTGYGGVVPGFSNIRAIALLEEAGLSRAEAIRVATLNGARYLGRDKEIGSVEPGKRADLVLFDGVPDDKPAPLGMPIWTMKAGVAYDAAAIRQSLKGLVGFN